MTSPIITIERHILAKQRGYPEATGDLTSLLYDMALAAKIIARETTRAGLVDILGAAETSNVYGERQQKLDMFADEVILRMNDHTQRLCAMASEEHEDILEIPPRYGTGKYVLLFDPLDGSSNIDVNVSIGTIFAIHRKITTGERGTMRDMLQAGSKLVAAGYVIYGSSTMMVYSTGQGVDGFTLDPGIGEFLLSHPDIRIPETPLFYSANQGYEKQWTEGIRRYTRWLQGLDGESEGLSQRYIGSMISDFHRNLLQGGVYYYPGDMQKPNGKIRLLLEAQAMAFIARNAGGYASDGIGDVLQLQPHQLHQRTPLFIGNRALVEKAERFIQQHDQDWIARYLPYRESVMQV
ncbi:MAG: class 1 fructose-bisphosphatase [Chloroflexota bacterium]